MKLHIIEEHIASKIIFREIVLLSSFGVKYKFFAVIFVKI